MNSVEIGSQIRNGQSVTTVATATDTVIQLSEFQDDLTVLTGSASGAIARTPDATSLPVGWTRRIKNVSSEFVKIDNGASGTLFELLGPGCTAEITLVTASAAGTWSAQIQKPDPSTYTDLFFDMESLYTPYPFFTDIATGAAIGATNLQKATCNGLLRQATGTTSATAYSSIGTGPIMRGSGAVCLHHRVVLPVLPTLAEGYVYEAVIASNFDNTGDNPAAGIVAPQKTVSNNWQIYTAPSGVVTYVDTGVAMVADTPTDIHTVINSNNTLISYYINKVLVGSITAGIPSAAFTGRCMSRLKKRNGTGVSIEAFLDLLRIQVATGRV